MNQRSNVPSGKCPCDAGNVWTFGSWCRAASAGWSGWSHCDMVRKIHRHSRRSWRLWILWIFQALYDSHHFCIFLHVSPSAFSDWKSTTSPSCCLATSTDGDRSFFFCEHVVPKPCARDENMKHDASVSGSPVWLRQGNLWTFGPLPSAGAVSICGPAATAVGWFKRPDNLGVANEIWIEYYCDKKVYC